MRLRSFLFMFFPLCFFFFFNNGPSNVHKLSYLKGGGVGQKLPILLSKKMTKRGGEGVKNCWFWDNIFYGWHLNCRSYFVKGISIGFPIRFHIHLKKFQEFNGFLKYVTFSIEFCPRRRIPEAIWILCLEFYKNLGGRILQKTVLIIK